MMVSTKDFKENESKYVLEMKRGKVFVYPTDTIYGLGCDATNSKSVLKIRHIKKRNKKPFSVIAPDKNWIRKNCIVDELVERWLKKLPGPYTLILELKNKKSVCNEVNWGEGSIGVRIPDSWFYEIVEKFGKAFVTTSVNISERKEISDIREMGKEMGKKVDYVIDEGPKNANGSRIVKLINGYEEVIRW